MSDTVLVALIGVIGTLVGAVAGFFGNGILEKKKAINDSKQHVSKVHFDLQVEIYKQMSETFFEVLIKLSSIKDELKQATERLSLESTKNVELYRSLIFVTSKAQNCLFENAPFIPENIFDKYESLYEVVNEIFWIHVDPALGYAEATMTHEELINYCNKKYDEIEQKLREINNSVRTYLSSLSILEEK